MQARRSSAAHRYVKITEVLEVPLAALPKMQKASTVPLALRPASQPSIFSAPQTSHKCKLLQPVQGARKRREPPKPLVFEVPPREVARNSSNYRGLLRHPSKLGAVGLQVCASLGPHEVN